MNIDGLMDHVYGGTLFFEIAVILAAALILFFSFYILVIRAVKPRKPME
jgi:hypothetical protein